MEKMRTLILVVFTLALSQLLQAQDQLTLNNGEQRKGEILSDDGEFVRLKKNNGEVLEISKSFIREMSYGNKANPSETEPQKSKSLEVTEGEAAGLNGFGQNILAFNYFNILHSNLCVEYEYIFPSGLMGLRVPLSVKVGDADRVFFVDHHVYTGLDFNIYPSGQKKNSYFIGPAFRVGRGGTRGTVDFENGFDVGYWGQDAEIERSGTYVSFVFKNGLNLQPSKDLNIGLSAGIGLREFFIDDFQAESRIFFEFSACAGYRF